MQLLYCTVDISVRIQTAIMGKHTDVQTMQLREKCKYTYRSERSPLAFSYFASTVLTSIWLTSTGYLVSCNYPPQTQQISQLHRSKSKTFSISGRKRLTKKCCFFHASTKITLNGVLFSQLFLTVQSCTIEVFFYYISLSRTSHTVSGQ